MRVTIKKCKYSRKIGLQLVEVINMANEKVIGKDNYSKRFNKCFKIEFNFTKKNDVVMKCSRYGKMPCVWHFFPLLYFIF
jgi:hypothetical protein